MAIISLVEALLTFNDKNLWDVTFKPISVRAKFSNFEFFFLHSSFIECYPLGGSSSLVGKVLIIGI